MMHLTPNYYIRLVLNNNIIYSESLAFICTYEKKIYHCNNILTPPPHTTLSVSEFCPNVMLPSLMSDMYMLPSKVKLIV